MKFLSELRRYNYVTPTSYLELLSTFKTQLGVQSDSLAKQKRRFTVGLDKLQSTEVQVNDLKVKLSIINR